MMFIDVRRAHLNAVCNGQADVELPEEMNKKGYCGKLKRWLYGMRNAAQGWEDNYVQKLPDDGYEQGTAAPTVFYCKKTEMRLVVHGDDFVFLGPQKELMRIKRK